MLKINEICPAGATVKSILGQSSNAAVYTTEDGQLRWNYTAHGGEIPDELTNSIARFDGLMSEIKAIAPEKHRTSCYTLLGKTLFTTLNDDSGKESERRFDAVSIHLHRLAQQRIRTNFVLLCMAATLIYSIAILSILHGYSVVHGIYMYCAVFGTIGACISVMQRSNDIDIDWTLDDRSLLVQAAVRVTLGFVFGGVFALACKADFILGAFKDNNLALYFLAIVAGFSERMIPELFGRLEAPGNNDA